MRVAPPVIAATAEMAALASAESLFDCLIDLFYPFGVLGDDLLDLIVCKLIDAPASGASEGKTLEFHPSDWHLKLCAAIASDRNPYRINSAHGWPLLVKEGIVAAQLSESSQSK